jgi:hypothetical protein
VSEETTGDPSGLFEGNSGAPLERRARSVTANNWNARTRRSADGQNLRGQGLGTPGYRRGPVGAFNPTFDNLSVDFAAAPGTGRRFRRRRIQPRTDHQTNRPMAWAALKPKGRAQGPRPRESIGSC